MPSFSLPSYLLIVLTLFTCVLQPEKVKFQLRLGQSKPLYNSFKAIQESPDWQSLSDARKRIVECEHLRYILFFFFPSLISLV